MKISVVSRHHNKQTREIEAEALRAGIGFELVNIDNLTRIGEKIESLGEVVIWRTASLDIGVGRAAFLTRLTRKRVVINSALANQPFVAYKFYQQKLVEPLKTILSIPTYYFKSRKRLVAAIENKILKYPFIMKANLGARGEKVFLINNFSQLEKMEVDIKDYVFQNYIKNKGDYRVLVLGGVALGVMRRVAREGEFRNNVSQGGRAFDATDSPEAGELSEKAITLASLFGLHFCGVDFIRDEEMGEFRFLEVNTVAQWQGFKEATGINVAEKLVSYCREMGEREKSPKPDLVGRYLELFQSKMPSEKRLHFLSRMYLWTGEEKYKEGLMEIKVAVLGGDDSGIRKRVIQLIEEADEDQRKMALKEETLRRKYYLDYPLLSRANNLLFFWLMARSIYGIDVRKFIEEVISNEEIISLRAKLESDEKATRHLSTAAVNLLYLSSEYLTFPRPSSRWLVGTLIRLGSTEKQDLKTAIYLLTHVVIGESLFYTRNVDNKEELKKIVKKAEKIIEENFFTLSLDTKLEFLVCANLVSYKSSLREIILGEAERSLSPLGNFLVDSHNDWKNRHTHKLAQAEHRNVLYLMACSRI